MSKTLSWLSDALWWFITSEQNKQRGKFITHDNFLICFNFYRQSTNKNKVDVQLCKVTRGCVKSSNITPFASRKLHQNPSAPPVRKPKQSCIPNPEVFPALHEKLLKKMPDRAKQFQTYFFHFFWWQGASARLPPGKKNKFPASKSESVKA